MDPETWRNGAHTVAAHLQTLEVVGGRQDGEVLHHAGPPQHSAWQKVGRVAIQYQLRPEKRLCSSVVLTESAAPTGSERLKHPRRTRGCHKDDCEGEKKNQFRITSHNAQIGPVMEQWNGEAVGTHMVRSKGLFWKAPSGIVAISLLWKPLEV